MATLVSSPPTVTSVVRSGWAAAPMLISGSFSPGEWSGAGILPIPGGYLMVKNDQKFLYLALDLVMDTGSSPGVGDYFWFSFDVNGNRGITPNRDVNYGIYPMLPIRLGRQYYLGPGVWTGILNQPTTSLARQGFGPSPASPAPHRIWEMRLDLAEVGVTPGAIAPMTEVPFGLRVASTSPAFVYDYPANFYLDFSRLPEIVLAAGPEDEYGTHAGAVIGGVGLIPATVITNGRATTDHTYYPYVQNAAFTGVMHLIGNRVTMGNLWNAGARKYRMFHRTGAQAFAPLTQIWSNYRWSGSTYVIESYTPDADNKYNLPDPGADYSIDDLLFQWNSYGFEPGMHEFRVEFYNAVGGVVPSVAQTLGLFLDNNLPDVRILAIRYRGTMVAPCDIVDILETADPVEVQIRVWDAEGDLYSYALNAYYGDNLVFAPALASVSYPGGDWQGPGDEWRVAPTTPKFPPVTCAYQLRLSAYPRTTNGYGYLGYTEASSHVTFRRAGAPKLMASMGPVRYPLGFSGPEGSILPGSTPAKVGE
ncbi:MAG TPA: hypothetical protein VFA33_06945 [Bryobacteraceae bacterium]|nr:hypothetical protein [Bryobacteraceae bacterium]